MDLACLERAFNAKTIAIVGDTSQTNFVWLRTQSQFKGKVYSVQVNPVDIKKIEAMGVQNYASVLDIPEQVDLAVVAVPNTVAFRILEECIAKKVAAAQFFTSGFTETGTAEGKRLENMIVDRAKQSGFHLIGPNCLGLYNPSIGLRQVARQNVGFTGPVGFISQSGTHATTFTEESFHQGLGINKAVSFGNGRVLDSTDYLEYFSQDEGIKAIGMYLEGVRDGRRFFQMLKKVAERKPVVIWKGGRTEAGVRAIASHTGSLAVPERIWQSAMRQCGAVMVDGLEELVDTLKAILYLSPITGRRMGIAGGSGGQSVSIADTFAEAGLEIPELSSKSYDMLGGFFRLVGAAYRNPIDPGMNRREMGRILSILESDSNIDNLVLMTAVTEQARAVNQLQRDVELAIELHSRKTKPISVIIGYESHEAWQEVRASASELAESGIPLFTSPERGTKAIRNALDFNNR